VVGNKHLTVETLLDIFHWSPNYSALCVLKFVMFWIHGKYPSCTL